MVVRHSYGVVVVGGGTSGAIAAVASARTGAPTLLVEKSGQLGGILSFGMALLNPADEEGFVSLGGIGMELIKRLAEHGAALPLVDDAQGDTLLPFDPEMAKLFLLRMAFEAGVHLLLNATVVGAQSTDGLVTSLDVATKGRVLSISCSSVVDCSGDADIVAVAGGRHVYGRPGDSLTQPASRIFWVGNANLDRMFRYFEENPQKFDADATRQDIVKLATTPGAAFSGFAPLVSEARANGEFSIPRSSVIGYTYPGRNILGINVTRVHGVVVDDPFALTASDVECQLQILEALRFLRKYIPGLENIYICSAPDHFGVRESRHIVGSYVLTREDMFDGREFDDQIGFSSYPFDIHDVKPGETRSGLLGDIHYRRITRSFGIPMRCLIPLDTQNIVVGGRAISADHEAGSSVRGQATCMVTGHAAGALAALSLQFNARLKDIPAKPVQKLLEKQGALISRNALQQSRV